jgi:MFS transporter, FSR family, fosmidomycin resistance protein
MDAMNGPARVAASTFRATLLTTALLDEFALGMLTVALPLARVSLHLSYTQAGTLFTVGTLSSLLLEPPINLASDRGSKRRFVLGGMLALAAGLALAGVAHDFLVLAVAFALIFPATGAAVSLSQAALIDAAPGRAPHTMARWTLFSSVGDLLAPLGVAAAAAVGLGWSALCFIAAGFWLGAAAIALPQRFPSPAVAAEENSGASGERIGALEALRAAFRERALLRWLTISLMATMLDEIFFAFVALHLHDDLGASESAVALALAAGTIGSMLGLVALHRLLHVMRGERLLPGTALLALAGVALLLLSRTAWLAALALFVVDLGAASWYPVAEAAAYAALPGRSGLVRTTVGVTAPIEMVLPAIAGLVAGHFGAGAAVLMLGIAPLGVLLAAPSRGNKSPA